MPVSALAPLQRAIHAALTASAPLQAYTRPTGEVVAWEIHDKVGDDATGPYIRIGEKTEVEYRVMGRRGSRSGWDDTATLHLWSPYDESDREILEGLSLVNGALLTDPLAVEGYGTVRLRMEIANDVPVPKEEGAWRHLAVRYRARALGVA